jgi:hypothetical protein
LRNSFPKNKDAWVVIWENRTNKKWDNEVSKEGEGIRAYLEFKPGQEVHAKVASYISLNRLKEILKWN